MMKNKVLLTMIYLGAALLSFGEDSFTFSADRTEAVLAEGKERTILTGHAVIKSKDTLIHADRMELYGKDFRFALCIGNIIVEDQTQGFRLQTESLYFDREKELLRVEGYSELEDQKNNLVMKSFFLENRGEENQFTVQIGVRILKIDEDGEMICRSEFAFFDRDTDTLELSGSPRVSWKGDNYQASRISINLETDEITLEGQVSGTIESAGEDDGE